VPWAALSSIAKSLGPLAGKVVLMRQGLESRNVVDRRPRQCGGDAAAQSAAIAGTPKLAFACRAHVRLDPTPGPIDSLVTIIELAKAARRLGWPQRTPFKTHVAALRKALTG
jgi:hypothetical protein